MSNQAKCSVCGALVAPPYNCLTCKAWFGLSGTINRCKDCGQTFLRFSAVEGKVFVVLGDYYKRRHWVGVKVCPDCRVRHHQEDTSYYYPQLAHLGTLLEYVAESLKNREYHLPEDYLQAGLPRAFIDAALRF